MRRGFSDGMGRGLRCPVTTPHASTTPAKRGENDYPVVAREGWVIVAGFVIVGLGLGLGAVWWLGTWGWIVAAAALAVCVWCVWFFRDPVRRVPQEPGVAVSPADGVVCLVDECAPPGELGLDSGLDAGVKLPRVCVFMNVFNVHVNRAPVAGVVRARHYRPGKFFNASLDKASVDNERLSLAIQMMDGRRVVCVQIAGLIARRIVCRVREGVELARGERYGLIRFGSRVDVYLPSGSTPRVKVGERAVAGETILAELSAVRLAEADRSREMAEA